MERTDIHPRMRIIGRDGQRLGRVISTGPDGVVASTGLLLRRRYRIGWDEVEGLTPNGKLRVARTGSGELPLSAKDLEEAKIDRAKYQSERLPPAPRHWNGTATSPLERMRMEEPTGLGTKTGEKVEPPHGPLGTAKGE
ncbi:MAG: hypothetical protein IRZ16_17140 [Myxococcaceae bacterium]|nr:hypothetical protein [Myxococcaceae bacterium]